MFSPAILTSFLLVAVAVQVVEGACRKYDLTFKPPSDPGDPSFITPASTELPVSPFMNIPLIILYLRQGGAVDLSLDGVLVQAVSTPLLRLSGDAVQLTQGQAMFRALQVQQSPSNASQIYKITFSITLPSVNDTYSVDSPPLRFILPTDIPTLPLALQFGTAGLIISPVQTGLELPINTVIPQFSLRLVNQLGYFDNRSGTVTIRCASGKLVTPQPTTVALINGVADIRNLRFVNRTANTSAKDALVFSATVAGVPGLLNLSTSNITISSNVGTTCNYIDFSDTASFLRMNNIGSTAVLNFPLPAVVIRCLNPQLEVDSTMSGVVVTASAAGARLSGDAAVFLSGYATFSDLMFTGFSPAAAVITFSTSGTAIPPRKLYSGTITVSDAPVKSKHLAFGDDSSLQSSSTTQMTFRADASNGQICIPLVSIVVRDSSFQTDPTATGVSLTVQVLVSSVGAPQTCGDTVIRRQLTTQLGVAKTRDFCFGVCFATPGSTFFVRVKDDQGIRATLDSTPAIVIPNVITASSIGQVLRNCTNSSLGLSCPASLSFAPAPDSFIVAAGQSVFTTVGQPIPEIRIFLNDAAGPVNSFQSFPSSVALLAFTGASPILEEHLSIGANFASVNGKWMGNYFSFKCIQFLALPKKLVRLQFGFFNIEDPTQPILVQGIALLRSGFLAVEGDTIGNYAIRFGGVSNSYFTYEGQERTAVVGVSLPPIELRLVDSLGADDSSGIGLYAAVTSSSGTVTMDTLSVPFVNGVATISTLRFLSKADGPVLTFSVVRNTAYAASEASLSTGRIVVSLFPIPVYTLQMVPVSPCPLNTQCVSNANQPITVASLTNLNIAFSLRYLDTSNEVSFDNNAKITFDVSSTPSSAVTLGGMNSEVEVSAGGLFNASIVILDVDRSITGNFTPIYLNVFVKTSSTYPHLIGSSIRIGPIQTSSNAGLSASCATSVTSPSVTLKTYQPISAFADGAALQTLLTNIAYLMGVESSRITVVSPPSEATGVRTDTARWRGSKVTIRFSDPLPTSSNRVSANALAASLVSIRPDCQASSLAVASIFYSSAEKGCVPADFVAAVQAADACVIAGMYTRCQCFQDNVVAVMGIACSIDLTVASQFTAMCQRLSTCQQSEIQHSCEVALQSTGSSYVWAFALFGAVIGVVGAVGYGVRSGLLSRGAILKKVRE